MEDKYDSDVGSSYPGGGEATKGMAVRHLKRYASWVQTVVRQVGLLSAAGVDNWEDLLLVREDRSELTSGVPALAPAGSQGSYVGNG